MALSLSNHYQDYIREAKENDKNCYDMLFKM